jgi:hypothetical protein
MISKKLVLSVIGAMIVLGSTGVVAREAAEGPRGADRVHTGTHKNSIDVDSFIIAREAAEGPRGADNERPGEIHGRNRGGRLSDDAGSMILARRGADDPVGSERPGEVHGQKRGGRLSDDAATFILAREAAEGPRGADNERPGDRQRRGGRTA